MSYLSKVFVSLTKKIQSFQRFQNFPRFLVVVLSYIVNSKIRKWRKIVKLVELWTILHEVFLWDCKLCFCSWKKAFFVWCHVSFRLFRRFRRFVKSTWSFNYIPLMSLRDNVCHIPSFFPYFRLKPGQKVSKLESWGKKETIFYM